MIRAERKKARRGAIFTYAPSIMPCIFISISIPPSPPTKGALQRPGQVHQMLPHILPIIDQLRLDLLRSQPGLQ